MVDANDDKQLLAILNDLNLISAINHALEAVKDTGQEILKASYSLRCEIYLTFTVHRLDVTTVLVEIKREEDL